MKTTKKFLSLLLVLCMVFVLSATAFADANETTTSGGTVTSEVQINTAAASFKVTVPSVLPVTVAADGTVTVAQSVSVVNGSNAPVKVKNITVSGTNGWSKVAFDTEFNKRAVGLQEFGLQLNGVDAYDGDMAATFSSINGNDSESFSYDANIAVQKDALSGVSIAKVVFTVAWDELDVPPWVYQWL